MSACQVGNQTLELYFMKVISLLEKHCAFSKAEARAIVRQTERQMSVDKENHIITLSQKLIPIPGLEIAISGGFKRDNKTLAFTIPLPDSYRLSVHSNQTGFPDPLQHNGWALSDALIPSCLHRPERLSLFPALIGCKKKSSQALVLNSTLIDKAKTLLKMKKQTFNGYKEEFLPLHNKLTLEIGKS